MKKIDIDMSHQVADVCSGKMHLFEPDKIIPLKQQLIQDAIERDVTIMPCGKDHFNINNNELVFWYNNLKDQSTKMATIKLGC